MLACECHRGQRTRVYWDGERVVLGQRNARRYESRAEAEKYAANFLIPVRLISKAERLEREAAKLVPYWETAK